MATVLKRKHNLTGASLLPLIRRFRGVLDNPIPVLARLDKDPDTNSMSKQDLNTAVRKLTGRESAEEIAMMVVEGPLDQLGAGVYHANEISTIMMMFISILLTYLKKTDNNNWTKYFDYTRIL